jgi:hypothetical protein
MSRFQEIERFWLHRRHKKSRSTLIPWPNHNSSHLQGRLQLKTLSGSSCTSATTRKLRRPLPITYCRKKSIASYLIKDNSFRKFFVDK